MLRFKEAFEASTNHPTWLNHPTHAYCKSIWNGLTDGSTTLYLGSCAIEGTIPKQIGSLSSLTALSLNNNKLNGTIPAEICGLTSATHIYLCNNQLSGAVPSCIFDMNKDKDKNFLICTGNEQQLCIKESDWDKRSKIMDFNACSKCQTIEENPDDNNTNHNNFKEAFEASTNHPTWFQTAPRCKSKWNELTDASTSLWLPNCRIKGKIPKQIGSLSSLTILDLNSNKLNGTIPKEICQLTSATMIDLLYNQLSGAVPSCMFEMDKVKDFGICSGNKLCIKESDWDRRNVIGITRFCSKCPKIEDKLDNPTNKVDTSPFQIKASVMGPAKVKTNVAKLNTKKRQHYNTNNNYFKGYIIMFIMLAIIMYCAC